MALSMWMQRPVVPAALSLPAKIVVGSAELDARVKDLNTHGLAAEIGAASLGTAQRRALAAGGYVHVKLSLDGRPLVLSGRVFWSNASHAEDARILVELEDLDTAELRRISAWREEREADLHEV